MSYHPQCVSDRRPLVMWAILFTGSLLLLAFIAGAPLARASQLGIISGILYQAFSYVCHQQPERSFFIAGQPLAVCARCTGVYAGFALTTLLYPLFTSLRRTNPPERKWLFIAVAPLAIDFGLGFLGIWENTHWSRFITGALFGSVVVFYVLPALAELGYRFGARAVSETKRFQPEAIPNQTASAPSDYSAPFRRI
ncbi:MAG: DUF2085 domain-containing protein [Pyrinomonadaceae bacterium]